MFGTVATIKIKEGKAAEFEKIATELVNKVNENEKGCLLYQLYYGEVPNTYVFMERYADQAAVEAHRSTEYFKTLGRAMAEFMDGKPTIQRLKQVGRFKQVGRKTNYEATSADGRSTKWRHASSRSAQRGIAVNPWHHLAGP